MLASLSRPQFLAVALAVAACTLPLASPVSAVASRASAPATVTVRVEGMTQTLLPVTEVTTTAAPVVKDGRHECSGTSAAGALQLATSGNWNGQWFEGLEYSVESIEGESYPFTQPYYWSFWFDNKPSTIGICQVGLSTGDSILFFPECFSETVGVCSVAAPNPLSIEAPATAEAATPFTVKVTSYANATGAPSPAAGATVAAGGVSRTTDSSGRATLALPTAGTFTVQASAPASVRTEAVVCVHNGNDGNCGTVASPGSSAVAGGSAASQTPASGVAGVRYMPPHALLARLTGLLEGHHYGRDSAPRLLRGAVNPSGPLRDVALRLTRRQGQKCAFYDGLTGRFRAMHCGAAHGPFFSVGSQASFSYLLPAALPRGRYVLDVEATDATGAHTTLARNSTRIVFYVGQG